MRNSSKRLKLLVGLVLLQVIVLLGLAFSYIAVDWYGKEIRLETAPVDPRDLFYGDYVILNYEISRLPDEMWHGGAAQPERGQRAYVLLRPSTEHPELYEAAGIYDERPDAGTEDVVLKARVEYAWDGNIELTYGFERYYVPEGTGKALEEQRENMQVAIKVAPWGQAKLSRLIIQP
ncbi:GDYXXLXY domain-containing protein [Paenibacillus abyssi]|uniref:GDYXXLXY domain-containing protein n=1 Tax=Paenibacillus abyssi TaxID=1340531 RepID=A0A917CYQ5_9BACL|nr:GDYXXLXY domain-containing protein [Paenibacillus abyssi]GGG02877.1 hypothetical protein GCM10010916_19950 [Paenibacillus abyssi]